MRGVQRVDELLRDWQDLTEGQPLSQPRQAVAERLTFDEFHDEHLLPVEILDPVERRDVRMIERGERACLAHKASAALRVESQVASHRAQSAWHRGQARDSAAA